MKTFIAFAYFFGCILILMGAMWGVFLLAPPEFVLDRAAISNHNGRFDHPGRIFPNFPFKEPFAFPGSTAGLVLGDDKVTAWVLVCKNKKEANAVFETYGSHVAKGDKWQSSGPGYLNYSLSDAGLRGQVKLIDEVIVHVQGKDDKTIERALSQAGLIVPNPKANILTEITHLDKYLPHLIIFILVYTAIQFPIWNRIASWAVTVNPKPGVQPVEETELRRRLFAINSMDVPFHVVEGKRGNLDVIWRLADAKWVGLMTVNKVSRVEILRMRLSDYDKSCRCIEISKALKASADGSSLQFAFSFSFFRGIVFGQWEYEKQFGLIFKNGGLTFDTAYEYKFNLSELKNPIVNVVVSSGWRFKPLLFFSRILGG
jgi:hypothetical protein